MILWQIIIPKLPLKFPPIKTLQMTPSHLDKWLFKASFKKGQNFSSKGGIPLSKHHDLYFSLRNFDSPFFSHIMFAHELLAYLETTKIFFESRPITLSNFTSIFELFKINFYLGKTISRCSGNTSGHRAINGA